MKCENIQELLMTDYLDGECRGEGGLRVKNHLDECETCRSFYETVLKSAAVLRKGGELSPPEAVWLRIRESLEAGQSRAPDFGELLRKVTAAAGAFRQHLSDMIPRPVLGAALPVMILAAVLVFKQPAANWQPAQEYLEEQLFYLADIGALGDDAEAEEDSLGAGLEIFLMG